MVRWSYLLPRLVVVAGVLFVIGILVNPVIHRTLVGVAWRTTRTQIEIGKLDAQLLSSKLDVVDLVVAHPKLSRERLFEADRIHLDFDTSELWRRKFVVDRAYVTGLKFDMQREPGDEFEFEPVFKFKKKPRSNKPQRNLADISKGLLKRELTDKLHTWPLLKKYKEEWPQRYVDLKQQVESIKDSAEKLEREAKADTVGSAARVAAAYVVIESVSKLHHDVSAAQKQLSQLTKQAALDRQDIRLAMEKDQEFLKQQMPLVQLDAEAWSHKLLGDRMTAYLKRAVEVAGFCRKTLPSAKQVKKPRKRRGRVVYFHDRETPGLLVRELLINGGGQFKGSPFQFSALAKDVSSNPAVVAKPTTFRFATKGSLVCSGRAEIDLRGERPRYRIAMNLPASMAGRYRVKIDDWSLAVSANRTKLLADLIIDDDVIQGRIRVVQQNLKFQRESDGDQRLVGMIVDGLQTIQSVDSTITIDGTPRHPKLSLKSTLGDQVAWVMNEAVRSYAQSKKDELLASFKQQTKEQFGDLEQIWAGGNGELNTLLSQAYAKIDELKGKLAAKTNSANPVTKGLKGIGAFLQR